MEHCNDTYKDLIEQLSVLEVDTWPDFNCRQTHFGEEQIGQLCARFSLEKRSTVNGFRDFVDCGGRSVPDLLQPLMLCARTLPCSTAECERLLSAVNIIVFTYAK